MKRFCILLAIVALAACSTAPQPTRSAEADARAQQLLAGKVAGRPLACLPTHRASEMVVVDDNTVIYRDGPNRVYVNNFNGGTCSRLGSGFYALKTTSYGSGPCRGDLAEVLDTSTGMTAGSCIFGDFVPYVRPGA